MRAKNGAPSVKGSRPPETGAGRVSVLRHAGDDGVRRGWRSRRPRESIHASSPSAQEHGGVSRRDGAVVLLAATCRRLRVCAGALGRRSRRRAAARAHPLVGAVDRHRARADAGLPGHRRRQRHVLASRRAARRMRDVPERRGRRAVGPGRLGSRRQAPAVRARQPVAGIRRGHAGRPLPGDNHGAPGPARGPVRGGAGTRERPLRDRPELVLRRRQGHQPRHAGT